MNKWSRFSYEELQNAEDKLVELSETSIISKKVSIGNGNFLYVLYCGNSSLPILLLLHGYCGASMFFFKILKKLSEKYFVIMVDLLGMGRSSRPSFPFEKLSDCENFFVASLECFRVTEKLTKFTIAGHSFGGYIAGCYSILYPEYIERLILLSPIGVAEPPPNYDYINYLNNRE